MNSINSRSNSPNNLGGSRVGMGGMGRGIRRGIMGSMAIVMVVGIIISRLVLALLLVANLIIPIPIYYDSSI